MARSSDCFSSYPFGLNLADDPMDHLLSVNSNGLSLADDPMDQLLPVNSNPGQNHVNETGSQLGLNGVVQTSQIPQRNPLMVALGQLGLGQKMTEMRSTYVSPYRVLVHRDHGHPQQPKFSLGEVAVTEVVTTTTRFLTPFSPREFQSRVMMNHDNNLNLCLNQNGLNFHDFFDSNVSNRSQEKKPAVPESELMKKYTAESELMKKSATESELRKKYAAESELMKKSAAESELMKKSAAESELMKKSAAESERKKKSAAESRPSGADAERPIIDRTRKKGDGRTHSLPHKKHGPYTCPRCLKVFLTSQNFAAHTTTHYKHETLDERRKRWAAKYRKKYLHFVHQSTAGRRLTSFPNFSRVPLKRKQGIQMSNKKDMQLEDEYGQRTMSPLPNQPTAGGLTSLATTSRVPLKGNEGIKRPYGKEVKLEDKYRQRTMSPLRSQPTVGGLTILPTFSRVLLKRNEGIKMSNGKAVKLEDEHGQRTVSPLPNQPTAGGLISLATSSRVPLEKNQGIKMSKEKDVELEDEDEQWIISPEAPSNSLVDVRIKNKAPSNSLVDVRIKNKAPSNSLVNARIKKEKTAI
ncbi:hypothetical protein MANES_03G090200v8 [Manihot esculenta]|uniref:C2H2-type domain-containing protein n=1 Tax=Manihot esculenta TaxID=3983 RepID=A0A2C9W5V4_MANES|nr:hypothetical protein MANES_03G090200v8 [Manihot esculenta]